MNQGTIDEIYLSIAQNILDSNLGDWSEATIECERSAEDAIGFSGGYIDSLGKFNTFRFRNFNTEQLEHDFHELYKITTENSKNRWNRAKFVLKPDGDFSIDFEWQNSL